MYLQIIKISAKQAKRNAFMICAVHSAMNSMVAEYLHTAGCHFSLSVFTSVVELPEQAAFTTHDLSQLLRLDQQPQLQERVQQMLNSSEGAAAL